MTLLMPSVIYTVLHGKMLYPFVYVFLSFIISAFGKFKYISNPKWGQLC